MPINDNMNKIKLNDIVNVQAYKYNGKLYRQWNGAKVLEVSPKGVTLFMYKTKVLELNQQKWVVREPMIWSLPHKSFYNTTGMIRKSGIHYYTNISSPPIYEDGAIKFIDFDIDIKAYPHEKIKVVDKHEFEKHSEMFHYSEKLINIVHKTTKHVITKIKYQEDIFDKDVIDSFVSYLVDEKELAKRFLKFNFD